jgi:hypothetical protein
MEGYQIEKTVEYINALLPRVIDVSCKSTSIIHLYFSLPYTREIIGTFNRVSTIYTIA